MSQASYVPDVAHVDFEALSFFTAVLEAIATNNAGATEPDQKFDKMFWQDTAAGYLKQYSSATQAWVRAFPDVSIQTQAVWNDADSEVESSISPTKLGAAIVALAPAAPSPDYNAGAAGITANEVGSYCLLAHIGGGFVQLNRNATVAGSQLRPAGISLNSSGGFISGNIQGSSMSGTWRLHGHISGSNAYRYSVFKRIS